MYTDTRTELIEALNESNASAVFISVAISETGVTNYPQSMALRQLETNGRVVNRGGGFMTALWEGKLDLAYSRADHKNQALLRAVFGPERFGE